jgi:hypothetical protein
MVHQRTVKIEIITGEVEFIVQYQHKENKFSHSIYTGWIVVGRPDG